MHPTPNAHTINNLQPTQPYKFAPRSNPIKEYFSTFSQFVRKKNYVDKKNPALRQNHFYKNADL